MALEVATYINQLNTANPVGSDPLAQADDHLRLLKTTLKNTFPNIDGPMTVTDDVLNALPARVTSLEAGGGGSGTATGIAIVSSLPASGTYTGETVFNQTNGVMYTWSGTAWVAVTLSTNYTPNVPAAIEIVSSLPGTATDGKVVFNTTDNKLYERVNGAWTEVTVTVNGAQEVADGAITTAKFAQGIRPLEVVGALPSTGNSEGRMVYLTTDDKIYRYTGAAWTASMPFGDLTGTIGADQIAANTITGGKIVAGSISADQIATGAISTAKLAAGAITAEKIAAIAITADKIATNAITSDKISANSITTGKIAAAAVGATELAANAITVGKLTSSSSTFNGVTFGLGAGASLGGYTAGVYATANSSATTSFLGYNLGGPGVLFGALGSYAAVYAYNGTNSSFSSFNSEARLAASEFAGYFIKGTRWIQLANASYAYQTSGGATGSFTGAHDGLIHKNSSQPLPGDIVVDVRAYAKPNVYDSLCVNAITTQPNQKGVVGVMAEAAGASHIPTAVSKIVQDSKGNSSVILDPAYTDIGEFNKYIINALGEGLVNVCGEGGDIEVGDLIVSSSIPGKGMKQADDIMRGYTVAKAREAVTFSHPGEIKQVACIYVCG